VGAADGQRHRAIAAFRRPHRPTTGAVPPGCAAELMRIIYAHCRETAMDARSPKRRKKPTNLSLDPDLLAEARSLGIGLSQFVESKLVQEVKRRRLQSWRRAAREAMRDYNEFVQRHGIFGEDFRSF
jgi:antitoxin CcdA